MNARPSEPLYPPEYQRYLKHFNDGDYFEAHEVLEALWRREKGPARHFLQGMIQIAAVFVHLKKRNDYGAQQLYAKALKNLQGCGESYWGVGIPALLRDVQKCIDQQEPSYHLSIDRERYKGRGKSRR